MQQKQKSIFETLTQLQKNKQNSNNWNITWEQGYILSQYILLKNPNQILEIGTSNGFSTLWLALEIEEDSNITTIEINKKRFLEAKNIFTNLKLNNITQINEDIFNILKKKELNQKFDFVFIDAVQSFYLDLLNKLFENNLLEKESIIIFDNINSHTSMDSFLSEIEKNYSHEVLDFGSGFLILFIK